MKIKIEIEIESSLDKLIQNLDQSPPATKPDLLTKLATIFELLNSLQTNDLLTFLSKAKVLEWVLNFALTFKQTYASEDLEMDHLVIKITKLLLVYTKAASLLCFELDKLPDNLPHFILNNTNPTMLNQVLDKKFDKFFNFYIKKTAIRDISLQVAEFSLLTKTAREEINHQENPDEKHIKKM